MTYGDILDQAYRMLDKNTSSIDSVTSARMTGWLQNRIRRVLSLPGMDQLRIGTVTLASVASQARYGLPRSVAKVQRVVDQSNYWSLPERDLNWLRLVAPNPTVTGTPEAWVRYGYGPVHTQPAAGSTLVAASTSVETTTYRVEGFLDGLPRVYTKADSGTGDQSLGDLDLVTGFTCLPKVVGDATLYVTASSGTALATIPSGQTVSRYQQIVLWPTPASVRTYTLDVELALTDIVSTESPVWPDDFHDLLVYGVCADEALKMDDDRRGDFEAQYAARVRDLKMWLWDSASNRPVPGLAGRRFSDLGPWYPSTRWR